MIDRILDILTSIDRRLAAIEDVMPALCHKVSLVEGVVAKPDGYVSFSGAVKTTKDEIKRALNEGAVMNLDSIQMDVRFSQAVFMGVRLARNPHLADALSDGALAQLDKTLKESERALDLLDKVEEREEEASRLLKTAWDKVGSKVESEVKAHVGELIEKVKAEVWLSSKLAEESLEGSKEEAEAERKRVEKAREGLELVLSEARSEKSDIRRETRAKRGTRSVASIRVK